GDGAAAARGVAPVDGGGEVGAVVTGVGIREGGDRDGAGGWEERRAGVGAGRGRERRVADRGGQADAGGRAADVDDVHRHREAALLGVGVAARDRVAAGAGIVGDGAAAAGGVAPVDGGGEVGAVVTGVGIREGGDRDGAG